MLTVGVCLNDLNMFSNFSDGVVQFICCWLIVEGFDAFIFFL